jgi:hypothetical protein
MAFFSDFFVTYHFEFIFGVIGGISSTIIVYLKIKQKSASTENIHAKTKMIRTKQKILEKEQEPEKKQPDTEKEDNVFKDYSFLNAKQQVKDYNKIKKLEDEIKKQKQDIIDLKEKIIALQNMPKLDKKKKIWAWKRFSKSLTRQIIIYHASYLFEGLTYGFICVIVHIWINQ